MARLEANAQLRQSLIRANVKHFPSFSPRSRHSGSAACAILVFFILLTQWAIAETPADVRRAELMYDQGTAAFEAGDYQLALNKMSRAFELSRSYLTAAGLGQVELHLGRHRDAAEHLDYSLRHFPTTADARARRQVMDGLAEARRHTFALSVAASVPGAIVKLDGQLIGKTPIDHDLYVQPGEHRLTVEASGFETFEQTLFAPAGGKKSLAVELRPVSAPATAEITRDARDSAHLGDDGSDWNPVNTWVLAIGGGVALATAGAGVAFSANADDDESRADDLASQLDDQDVNCAQNPSPGCSELLAARSDSRDNEELAKTAWLVSGVTLVATVGLFTHFHFANDDETPPTNARLVPVVGPTGSGFVVSGSF